MIKKSVQAISGSALNPAIQTSKTDHPKNNKSRGQFARSGAWRPAIERPVG
jgi:hypothetical protein